MYFRELDEQRKIQPPVDSPDVPDTRMWNRPEVGRFQNRGRKRTIVDTIRYKQSMGVQISFLFQQRRRMDEYLVNT